MRNDLIQIYDSLICSVNAVSKKGGNFIGADVVIAQFEVLTPSLYGTLVKQHGVGAKPQGRSAHFSTATYLTRLLKVLEVTYSAVESSNNRTTQFCKISHPNVNSVSCWRPILKNFSEVDPIKKKAGGACISIRLNADELALIDNASGSLTVARYIKRQVLEQLK